MLRSGFFGLLAIGVLSLSSYLYQLIVFTRLSGQEYAFVMVGSASVLAASFVGSGLEAACVVGRGRPSAPALAALALLAAVLASGFALVGMWPLGVRVGVALAAGCAAALVIVFSGALGRSQACERWERFILAALLYAIAKVALATVCFDAQFAVLVPGLAAGLGTVAGLGVVPPHRLPLRGLLPVVFRFAPIPVLTNLDLWLAPYWLGAATPAYAVPALLARPVHAFASGLSPLARRVGAEGGRPKLAAAVAALPLAAAPLGMGALLWARPLLPAPWNGFEPGLLTWAVLAQAAVGALYLLFCSLGPRMGWRWLAVLLLLPGAFLHPPLCQLLVSLLAGALLLLERAGALRGARDGQVRAASYSG
ncbi:MAG: hypothetical protein ACYC4L_07040 [Chloroflexota bacterium]